MTSICMFNLNLNFRRKNKLLLNRSKGYGFVTFTRHEDALACLRKLNNNPDIFDKNNVSRTEYWGHIIIDNRKKCVAVSSHCSVI